MTTKKPDIKKFIEENKGALMTEYAALYMETQNEANRRYNEELDTIIAELKKGDKVEKKLDKLIGE